MWSYARRLIVVILIIAKSCYCNATSIQDYGVYGNLFPVQEESLLEEIMSKLHLAKSTGRLEQLQQEFANKVKAKILRPLAVPGIKKAELDRSWTYDPSYLQETDITDGNRVNVKSGVWHDQATLLSDCSFTNSPSTNGTLLTTKVNKLNP